jgi:hypothetical protein
VPAPAKRRTATSLKLQRGILLQDRLLEPPHRWARLEAQFVVQQRAPGPICRQHVRLATGPIQRQHQLLAQPLAQREARQQRLQLRHQRAIAPQRQLGLDAFLHGRQSDVLEPANLDVDGQPCIQVGERRPAPHRKRGRQALRRALRRPGVKRATAFVEQPLKAIYVELVRRDAQQIPRRSCEQSGLAVLLATEHLAQAMDVGVERMGRARRRLIAPQRVDENVTSDDRICPQEQERQQRTLLRPPERQRGAVRSDLERPQDSEFHRGLGA